MNYNTLYLSPGDILMDLCRRTTCDLILIAPFIKTATLDRLLSNLQDEVNLLCITRWKPAEIASGVSDLEVFQLVTETYNGVLKLRQDLHIKYYRGDSQIFVGSANLTQAALGWSTNTNLELLVPIEQTIIQPVEFEMMVQEGTVDVDQDLYNAMTCAASEWKELGLGSSVLTDTIISTEYNIAQWLPSSRHPAVLYTVYQIHANYQADKRKDIPTATWEAGINDLAQLQPPSGLSRETFDKSIGATILTMPLVSLIDKGLATPQHFGAIRDLLKQQLGLSHDEASRKWQTLLRWLLHFLPERYEYSRPNYSEIISKVS